MTTKQIEAIKSVSKKNLTNTQLIIADAIAATERLFEASLGKGEETSILLDDARTALLQALANLNDIVPQR